METHRCMIDAFGRMHIDPTIEKIGTQLEMLFTSDTEDCPHRDLSLSDYASGYVLTYHHNRILTLENTEHSDFQIQFISGVALEAAFALFKDLNNRDFASVLKHPWKLQS